MPLTAAQLKEVVDSLRKPSKHGDRRRTARLQVQASASISSSPEARDEMVTVLAHDISREGAGLISSMPLEQGQQILVHLPNGEQEGLYVVCTVRHCGSIADGIYCHGVQFNRMIRGDEAMPPAGGRGIEKIVEMVLLETH
jgi:hypothetical protein